jgi:glycosyltransferase involved in cell wall biosynthesis
MTGSAAPTVSVLMPTFDRAALIGEAIASILAQTFADFEVIVIDDGSTDHSAAVLRTITDPRVRVLHQANRGISAALNTGLLAARGRYVTRLDSDDWWQPTLLATLVPVLETRAEVGVVYAQADAMEHGRIVPHLQGLPLPFPDDAFRSLVYDDCTCNIALLARRACLDRAGPYDESLIANEDWDMWLRVARQTQFVFIPEVLARIRWHPQNLTGLQSARLADVLAARRIPLDKVFALPDLPPAVAAMRSVAYANVHLFCGLRWWTVGDRRAARREFRQVIRLSDRPTLAACRIAWRTVVLPWMARTRVGRRLSGSIARCYRSLS